MYFMIVNIGIYTILSLLLKWDRNLRKQKLSLTFWPDSFKNDYKVGVGCKKMTQQWSYFFMEKELMLQY